MKNEEPDKVDLKSLDIAEAKRLELLRLFPEVGDDALRQRRTAEAD